MKRSIVHSERAQELLVERALRGLDDKGYWELDNLGAGDDDSFDLAAAAVDLATLPIEPMPAALATRLAPPLDAKTTLPGVMPERISGSAIPAAMPESSQTMPADELASRRARAPRRSWAVIGLAAAASLVLAAGVWYLTNNRGTREVAVAPVAARADLLASASDAAPIAWEVTADPTAHGATGDVVWSPAQQRGFMRFVGLAPNDPARFQYQLWIFDKLRDERYPVDGGVFDVSSSGEVIVAIAAKLHVDDATLFAVTVEQPGGVVVSKRERIVVTAARKSS